MIESRIKNMIEIKPKERRQIQLIQLEILLEIDRICTKHNIAYRMVGGTLIGAARHKGFVPWDPDADIAMNRYSYNKFFEVCKTELNTDKFFLQEWRTDEHYRWSYARILRKDTEFVRAGHEHLKSKNGICVDVIATDYVPNSKILQPLHTFSCFAIRKVLWSEVGKKLADTFPQRCLYKILSYIPRNWVFRFRDWVISWVKEEDIPTKLTRNMSHGVSKKSPCKWGYPIMDSKDDIKKVFNGEYSYDYLSTRLEFEGHMLMASKNYETGLKNTFGDYMKLPPVSQRVSHIPCSKLKLIKPDLPNYDELVKKVYLGENNEK